MVRRRRQDARTAIVFGDARRSWDQHARESATRAAVALARRRPGPFHIGYLLENVPEPSLWLGTGAVNGATGSTSEFPPIARVPLWGDGRLGRLLDEL